MNNKILRYLGCALLLGSAGLSHALNAPVTAKIPAKANVLAAQTHPIVLSFKKLGIKHPIRLLGAEANTQDVDFSFNTVDIVRQLNLRLKYSHSPTLDPQTSYLQVKLNGVPMSQIALTPEHSNVKEVVIPLNPILLEEWNHLSFHMVAHMSKLFTDEPRHPQLWLQIDATGSALEAQAATLPVTNDLKLFPIPFFDKHDTQHLSLPMVFAAKPSLGALKAAGVLSSWFGSQAAWRKVGFPSHFNTLPEKDGIVFMTTEDRIDGVNVPAMNEGLGAIHIINNPRNKNAHLLLVVGRGDEGLIQTAQALALGQIPLQGASQVVRKVELPQHSAYDAPRWSLADRPIRVGDVVAPERMQFKSYFVTPFHMVLKLPPNLYRADAAYIPFDFQFKASNHSRFLRKVEALINGIVVQQETLSEPDVSADDMVPYRIHFRLPNRNLTGEDTISVKFHFADKAIAFNSASFDKDEIQVDPNSNIDLTQTPRHIELPNVAYLAYTGFPFSKQSDLSETVVLLPIEPTHFEVESMLAVLGHIGNRTGVAAAAVEVARLEDAEKFANKDILVVGQTARLSSLLDKWKRGIQVNLLSDSQPFPHWGSQYFHRWMEWAHMTARFNSAKGEQGMVVLGFESPMQSKRSVLVLTAANASSLPRAAEAINTLEYAKDFAGDTVALDDKGKYISPVAFNRAPKFEIGSLPLFEHIRRTFYHNPWLAILITMLLTILFAALLYRKLKRKAEVKLGMQAA